MATVAEALDIAVQHHRSGRLAEAEGIYRQILAVEPDNADALHLLGVVAHQLGRNDDVVDLITRAVAANPGFAHAHFNLGLALQKLGRLNDGVASYRRALALTPDFVEAVLNLGNTYAELGLHGQAIDQYRRMVQLSPNDATAHARLGNALKGLGRLVEAVECYRRAIAARPDFVEAHCNLGGALEELGHLEQAEAAHRRALAIDPGLAAAHSNLGSVLRALDRADEAVASCQTALALQPDSLHALCNLAVALVDLGRFDEATTACRSALAIDSTFAKAHNALGAVLARQGHTDEAVNHYDTAIELQPDLAEARLNRSLALLVKGSLGTAWEDYEARWKLPKPHPMRPFPQPWWTGEALTSETLLIWGEMGVGDEILGIGMLPDAMARAPRCMVECDARLVELYARSFPAATFAPRKNPPDPRMLAADRQIPMFGLARHFRAQAADFRRHDGYLVPDTAKAARWNAWVDGLGAGVKVGLSWRGRLMNWERSRHFAPLDLLAETVLAVHGLVFVNLQYDGFVEDVEIMERRFGVRIHSPEGLDLTNDLDDVAALMTGLDAVVGPATAVGYLAGAVGRPVWMYAYYPPSNEKEICHFDHVPWCPSIRVETCGIEGDWSPALHRIANELAEFATGGVFPSWQP